MPVYQLEIAFREHAPDGTVGVLCLPLGEFVFSRLIFFGVLPPRDILNTPLMSGESITMDELRAEWPPMQLDEHDYLRLRQDIETHPAWGGVLDDSWRQTSGKDWFHWAFMRSMTSADPRT